jgi:hydrogenase small subunit
MENFILVVEGSIPNEHNKEEGYWASLGTDPKTGSRSPPVNGSIVSLPTRGRCWRREPAPLTAAFTPWKAIPRDAWGSPTTWAGNGNRKREIPIVCVPGCPVQPDNFMETLLYLLYMASGRAPMIPLDEALRPTWLFGNTVHEGCDRGGFYEQAQFAEEYGSPLCIVKLGCWGPVVQCNVGKRGWMGGIGGCPNVGGICIGCTMPGFPDKFMPFMNQPPGSLLSSAAVQTYGRAIHALRRFTQASLNKEPSWRKPRASSVGELLSAAVEVVFLLLDRVQVRGFRGM